MVWLLGRIRNFVKRRVVEVFRSIENDSELTSNFEQSLLHLNGLSGVFYPHERKDNGYIEFQRPKDKSRESSLPLPPITYREYYGVKDGKFVDDLYLQSGKTDTDFIRKVLSADNFSFGMGKHIFEFGCAGGRMLRWFENEASFAECWGCDVNTEALSWCQQNLSPPLNFFPNTTAPHLPFHDAYFSLIFAGSVFTHIGELADTWLLELRRILDKDGRIYITVFDEIAYEILLSNYPNAPAVGRLKELNRVTGIFDKPYGKYVFSTTPRLQRVGYRRDYLLQKLSLWFDVKGVFDEAYGWQTGVLLAKK